MMRRKSSSSIRVALLECSRIKMESSSLNLICLWSFLETIPISQIKMKHILIVLMTLWSLPFPYLAKKYGISSTNSIISSILQTCQLTDSTLFFSFWSLNMTVTILTIEEYDAFVILHGTDTLTYTASALSFMVENLKKTVIVTGSQVPIG